MIFMFGLRMCLRIWRVDEILYVESFEAVNGDWHYHLFFDKNCKDNYCCRTNENYLVERLI
jgi:hypothetical protein